jgi:hypothetical protein
MTSMARGQMTRESTEASGFSSAGAVIASRNQWRDSPAASSTYLTERRVLSTSVIRRSWSGASYL